MTCGGGRGRGRRGEGGEDGGYQGAATLVLPAGRHLIDRLAAPDAHLPRVFNVTEVVEVDDHVFDSDGLLLCIVCCSRLFLLLLRRRRCRYHEPAWQQALCR